MHLVEHRPGQVVHGAAVGVEHVAKDLGGHHDHRCVGRYHLVTGHQTYPVRTEHRAQVAKLLVGQGLDGCRVERTSASSQRRFDRVLGHHRLAARRRSRHQNRTPGIDGSDRLLLEAI